MWPFKKLKPEDGVHYITIKIPIPASYLKSDKSAEVLAFENFIANTLPSKLKTEIISEVSTVIIYEHDYPIIADRFFRDLTVSVLSACGYKVNAYGPDNLDPDWTLVIKADPKSLPLKEKIDLMDALRRKING